MSWFFIFYFFFIPTIFDSNSLQKFQPFMIKIEFLFDEKGVDQVELPSRIENQVRSKGFTE